MIKNTRMNLRNPAVDEAQRNEMFELIRESVRKETGSSLHFHNKVAPEDVILCAIETAYFYIFNTKDIPVGGLPEDMLSLVINEVGQENVTVLEKGIDAIKIRLKNHVWWLCQGLFSAYQSQMPWPVAHIGVNKNASLCAPRPIFPVCLGFEKIIPILDELFPEIEKVAMEAARDKEEKFRQKQSVPKKEKHLPPMPERQSEERFLKDFNKGEIIDEAVDSVLNHFIKHVDNYIGFAGIPDSMGFRHEVILETLSKLMLRLDILDKDWHPSFLSKDLVDAFHNAGIPGKRFKKTKGRDSVVLWNSIIEILSDARTYVYQADMKESVCSMIHFHGCQPKDITAGEFVQLLFEFDGWVEQICEKADNVYSLLKDKYDENMNKEQEIQKTVKNALAGKGIDYHCFVEKDKVTLSLEKIVYSKTKVEVPLEKLEETLSDVQSIIAKGETRCSHGVDIWNDPFSDRQGLYKRLAVPEEGK